MPLDEFKDEFQEDQEPGPTTRFYPDDSRSAFATNSSPDIPFSHSINPYRGCEHGCAYCYARPTHEYLGLNAGADFESVIFVKEHAAALARSAMQKKSWQPTTVSISGVTDPYQPGEHRFRVTRSILEVMLEFRNPIAIVTKNRLVTRDIDLLSEMSKYRGAAVFLSVTSLNRDLSMRLEPRTSTPKGRLQAIEQLSRAGIPVGAMVAPVIPGLNDQEIPAILRSVADAGARWASRVMLRLPLAVEPIFLDWLDREEPGRSEKVKNALRQIKGGKLNESEFGRRMTGSGPRADALAELFEVSARRYGLNRERLNLSTESFRRPGVAGQQNLF